VQQRRHRGVLVDLREWIVDGDYRRVTTASGSSTRMHWAVIVLAMMAGLPLDGCGSGLMRSDCCAGIDRNRCAQTQRRGRDDVIGAPGLR
jgi:hypothetical protein